ncbi:MAG TPA: menaquinone biosynthesis protein [Pyrinomonadaceae bacterium]|jgi:chorismate dehydratase|nr:menaquinone biosynthesis protein [Pyrinomonadaceae bacterium]
MNEVRPRLAASSYLNSAPLLWSFTNGSRLGTVDLIDAVPAVCADRLRSGDAEAALVPVIEYQRIRSGVLVPNVCVGSRERVRSVVLVTRCNELRDLKRIALDESSRTSATLLKIIYKEFLGLEPDWRPRSPDLQTMLEDNDGALMIGDPAMVFPRNDLQVFDLASLWRNYSDLGFVFAMWMLRDDAPAATRNVDFAAARDEGVSKLEEIIDSYEPVLKLSRAELRTYLTENISFSLDEDMKAGLDLYFKLAFQHGLIPELKPLVYL